MTTSTAEGRDLFPAGLKVLIVDDDATCLLLLEHLLLACHYQVTKCQRATDALSLLRGNEGSFDIVMSDIHMPDFNGIDLLEIIGLEMDLPVVVMSNDVTKDMVMKIIIKGACDYLIKPIRMEEIRVIWQHVVRKRNNNSNSYMLSKSLECGRGDRQEDHRSNFETNNHEDGAFMRNKVNNQSCSNYWTDEKDHQDHKKGVPIASQNKQRMVWTTDLHEQFVAVVNHMGLQTAVPKKILAHMNVPNLTRENVASHLQKYRLHLQRKTGNRQMKQLEFQSSIIPKSDAERLDINVVVGTPSDQRISYYNERLPSQQEFENGRQLSWYQGTEGINHLPSQVYDTSTTIAQSEQERFPLVERLMQSSVGMERSNDHLLVGNRVPDLENYYAAGACVTMSPLDQYEGEVIKNGPNLGDFDYGMIFLDEQRTQEGAQLLNSSNPLSWPVDTWK